MKNVIIILSGIVLVLYSCQKIDIGSNYPLMSADATISATNSLPNCLGKGNINYHWINDVTHIRTYSGNTIISTSIIYPNGFFRLNEDQTYNVISNGATLNGTWAVRACNTITLDPGRPLERTFDIVSVSPTSLLITRKTGDTEYIQHYTKVANPITTVLGGIWECTDFETSRIQGGTELWKVTEAVSFEINFNPNGTFTYTDRNNPVNNLTGYGWNMGSQVLTFSYGFYPWCIEIPARVFKQGNHWNKYIVNQINANSITLTLVSLDDLLCRESIDKNKFGGRNGSFQYRFLLNRK